jgi:ketosteroid isomerase-like protein
MSLADDRAEICDLLARYGRGLDDRNFDAVRQCFAVDAQATFSGVVLAPGREAIVTHVSGLATMPASTHLFGAPVIEVQGDGARSETSAVAFLHTSSGEVLTRGLRYIDVLQRTPDGWRIVERVHRVDWMYSVAGVTPSTPRP